MTNSFFDRDNDGDFDIVDIFWLALQLVAYLGGVVFMLSTFGRSFHLLSSAQMMPQGLGEGFAWWPWLTAIGPEFGLVMAWLAGEVGFRKGKWELIATSIAGGLLFGIVIATLQLYDVALSEGSDLSGARGWAHTIAAILPLITIAYSAVLTMILSAMARWDKVRGKNVKPSGKQADWKVEQPRIQNYREPSLPIFTPTPTQPFPAHQSVTETRRFGEAITDPARHTKASAIAQSTIRSNGGSPPKNFE